MSLTQPDRRHHFFQKFIITLLALLVFVLLYSGWVVFDQYRLRAQYDAYIKPILTELIDKEWPRTLLKKNASPRLANWLDAQENEEVALQGLRDLGRMVSYEGVQNVMQLPKGRQALVLVTLTTGQSYFLLTIIENEGKWVIDSLSANALFTIPVPYVPAEG